jgi:hypothetical protein
MKPSTLACARRAFALLGLSVSLGMAQGDPLVSKNLPYVFADEAGFWVFAADGLRFSRIDPSKDPLDIRNGQLNLRAGIRGGLGRASTALLFYGYTLGDTAVGGLLALTRDGKPSADSVAFLRPKSANGITAGAEFSALAQWKDTLVIGAGRAGIAVAKSAAEGKGVLADDSLAFRALPAGEDTGVSVAVCARNGVCPVAELTNISDKIGEPDSVSALAVDTAADSTWLLIGTRSGLRRGLLAGNSFPTVPLPTAKPGAVRIEGIFAEPERGLLWVFTGSEYFFSGDHGRSFHKPPRVAGLSAAPDSLGSSQNGTRPSAAFSGDTTFINLNLKEPGLIVFRKDTLLANLGTGDLADVLLDKADGLAIESGRLTTLASVPGASGTILMAGSTFNGIYMRRGGAWSNVNSLKALKKGLDEVITFPTLFSGTTVDGQPEFVHLGYRLKKNGKVTITVYNYAMEKVKTLVKNARRQGGGNRSENPNEDVWDGKDASGRHVSVGVYYILVESDAGEKGWGKAIAVHGRGQ